MEELLILGIVPHTDIQVSFVAWIIFVQTLLLAVLLGKLAAHKVRAMHLTALHYQTQVLTRAHQPITRRRLA